MSSARHHAEWLGLIEQSGPFLSLPVLLRVFPQGLETVAPEIRRRLAQAYAEWRGSCEGGKPDPVLHQAWIRFVLDEVLELPEAALLRDQALPKSLQLNRSEEGEILRPDVALVAPHDDVPPGSPASGATRQPRLLIQTYAPGQRLDKTVPGRFWKASPAARMADLLRAADVPLGLVSNGEDWLLIHAPREVETASYATWHASLWSEEPLTLRAFASLLGVRRWFGVAPRDQLAALFAESAEHQEAVTAQLGAQVLAAVEILIQSIDRLDKERGRALLDGESVARLYESGLTVMMRLVFLLFAEERDLLPADNPIYAQHYAVFTLGAQLRETADQLGEEILERRYDAWNRLLALFRLIYAGSESEDLRLPAYGGHLFDPDRFPFLEGRPPGSRWQQTRAEPLPIHNRTVLHLLEALQYLKLATPGGGPAQARRLSFRALTEENIGTVYEGLLDHTARRTQQAMLGLSAAKGSAVERPLTELEAQFTEGEQALVAALKQSTKRSASALSRALSEGQAISTDSTQADDLARLRTACDNDEALLARVRPFAKLLRADSQGYPFVITPGSVFVTAGQDRRSSGTHYTPPELTEPIVRHALNPLVYAGMAEGIAPSRETLRAPAEILALRVCDLACGSGAFLVQGCRYLADKLVAAWEQLESRQPGQSVISPEGALASERPVNCPIPSDPEARRMVARRLVADRCLYGVDINPLAVEMAKLSLWLVTLQRDKPFTFLDHALVAGDSLLGIAHLDELEAFYMDEGGQHRVSIHADNLRDAAKKRVELVLIPDNSLNQIESKALLLQDAEEAVRQTRLLADLVTGAKLAAAGAKRKRADALLQTAALLDFGGMEQQVDDWLKGQHPLHWPLTFPEVFLPADSERAPGFDAFVGNPPFMGGQKITGNLSTAYRHYLVSHLAAGQRGSADLCAYFFLRAVSLLRPAGMAGLLATNTIAQGDTREVGLDQLAAQGVRIPRAIPSRKWPGSANLEVAHVWLHRAPEGRDWQAGWLLNDRPVSGITPYLTEPGAVVGPPQRLKANEGKSFQGSIVLGMGFVLDPDEAEALLTQDPKHHDCLFPYLNGEDLNSRPDQSPSRWVINFHDWPLDRSAEGRWIDAEEDERKEWLKAGRVPEDYPGKVAADYPALLRIVEVKVKPERMGNKRKIRRERWWQYAERAPKLYATIEGMERVLVCTRVSKHLNFEFAQSGTVFTLDLFVFALLGSANFGFLQSTVHEIWVRATSSTQETRMRYTTTDCFETFPFPESLANIDAIGERYYNHRQQIMQARQEGLTKTYNRFHDQDETSADIAELRALHVEMDQAVAAAYGWSDLDLGHDFHDTKQGLRYTLSEPARREVLDRLLRFNHERYAQEVAAGLHDKAARKASKQATNPKPRRKRKEPTETPRYQTLDLFAQEPPT
ncbi:MAG: restriction endonuclease [Chromatiaceae bacterium]|nr:restriction endonuclease [Chromatiaceae bacterium]MCF7994027.1 restriction endonuclease [Chromatiaceae bacterium]